MADGSGNQLAQAPNIAGLQSWYVEAQIQKFQTGARGAHPDDVEGLKMRPMSRTLKSTEDIQVVAAYVSSLPPVATRPVLKGDPERGEALFKQNCAACHGVQAEGNQALNAPRLAGRDDWYVATQLRKFRAGIRGTAPADATGAQMRAMALTLPDEQAIRDVSVYVSRLE